MENIIKVNNLSKTYRYNNIFLNAVNDISFNIKKGESILVPPHINVTLKGNFEILRTIIE